MVSASHIQTLLTCAKAQEMRLILPDGFFVGYIRLGTRLAVWWSTSLVPRPHPAHARRKGLVSQVQILGLVPETWSGQSYRRTAFIGKVPVRYRPNAASGGWGYGRDLCHCHAVKRGYTRFDITSLNIHKPTSRWHLAVVLRPRLLTFACLAGHPTNCSTALPKVFSRDLQVC